MSKSLKIAPKNENKYIEIGLNISFYRKRARLTQEQLAEKAEISRQYIGEIEAPNMITPFSLEVLFNIADALGVTPSKLLEIRD